jgi:hypothetical protein
MLVLETSVLFYYFHNFIAQLRSAPRRKKIAIGISTLDCIVIDTVLTILALSELYSELAIMDAVNDMSSTVKIM